MGKNKKNTAFTLIELIVSIAIISVLIVSFTSVTLLSMHSVTSSEQKYLAAKIAQEGMELLLNKKENHVMAIENGKKIEGSDDWQTNLLGPGEASASWKVDAVKAEELLHTGKFDTFDSGKYLCFETNLPNRGKFTQECGGAEKIPGDFTREVVVEKRGYEDRIFVKSIVRWKNKGLARELILEGLFFGLL